MNREFIYFDKTESVLESVLKDLVTLFVVSFFIYISQDNTFWTIISGALFFILMITRVSDIVSKKRKVFKNRIELIDYLKKEQTKEDIDRMLCK